MRSLEELNNRRQSLERQLDNCRYDNSNLEDELTEVENEIQYITDFNELQEDKESCGMI
jgi:prefoldin subunit 5